MNTAYKTVWNAAIGAWVAVSETTRARGKRSTSQRAGRAARFAGPTKIGMLAGLAFFATGFFPAQAVCTVSLADVTCNGAANPLAPGYANGANNLNLVMNPGASLGVLLGLSGSAVSLTGFSVRLTNNGRIDPLLFGNNTTNLSTGVVMGDTSEGSTIIAVNNATISGTRRTSVGLDGLALTVRNGINGTTVITNGITTINNTGTITTGAVLGATLAAADAAVVAVYGGGQVNMVNTDTGTITGRIAFESPASGGNTFTNAGTINGSVSLGTGERDDTFFAVTGSSITGGSAPAIAVATPSGGSLNFAAGGTVDAGLGGTDMLVLRNEVYGPGSGTTGSGEIKAAQYTNFENLQVDSGTWTLGGAVVSGSALLNGGLAIFDDAGAFGSGTLTGNGGAIQAAVNGLTLAQNVNLTGGLFVQGANDLTLGGTVSGAAGLIKNGTGTLTLNGINNFSGGFALNGGGVTLGNASSLGTGLFLVGGNVALNTVFTGTLNNQVHLNGALTLDGTGTLTFGNVISGAGSLTVNGSNLALAASNTYGGGTTLGGGRLDVGSNTALGTGDLTINGASVLTGAAGVVLANNVVLNSTLNFGAGSSGGALTLNGVFSGAGGISLAGAPGLTLNGANTFTGGFNLGAGALVVGNDKAMGQAGVTVSGPSSLESNKSVSLANDFHLNAALAVGGASDLALNGAISGLRGLTKSGTGRLTLGGANSFSGGVNLQSGALRVGTNTSLGGGDLTVSGTAALDASAAVKLANDVVLNANLDIGGANDIALGGQVTGAGGLSYSGSGTLMLGRNNGFSGGTTLNSGTLTLGDGLALGIGALAVTGNANLRSGVANIGVNNNLTLGAGATLNVDGSNPLALTGTIGGDGALALGGTGAVGLTGANTYGGGTTVTGTLLIVANTSGSATGSGTVQVQGGGTLGGRGSIAGTVNVGDGILSPGAGGAGTLTVGGLNLAAGSVLNYELGQAGVAGGTLNDLVDVNGNLQLDGTLNVSETAGGKFGAGLYRLINYTGTLTDNGLDIGSAPTDTSKLQVQTSVANQVNLVNSDGLALNVWDGGNSADFNDGKIAGGSGAWRAGGPGENWADANGLVNGTWVQDGFAVFTGKAGTVTVDNKGAGGPVRIGGVQFAVDGYVVNGDALTISAPDTMVRVGDGTSASAGMTAVINASIGGTGGLVKDDGGTLVLGAANSYTGGTTVKDGVLQISTDSNLGAAGTGLALDGGTLRIAAGSAPFFSVRALALGAGGGTIDLSNSLYGVGGPITGSGRLTVTGKGGTLGLVSANSYSGGTVLENGASITTTVSGVLGSGAVQQQGNGTLLSLLGTASAGSNEYTVGRAASADSGNTLSFSQSATAAASKITLNGTGWTTPGSNALQFGGSTSAATSAITNAGGVISFFENASAGAATISNGSKSLLAFNQNATAGSAQITNASGGLVYFADNATSGLATVANAAGGVVDVSGSTAKTGVELGSLSGAGGVVLGATQLALGGLGTSDTISGTVSDKGSIFAQPGSGTGGSIVKVGAGTLTLSGANTYTGGTIVAAGTLSVNNASGSATGTGAVQILGNAMLAGSGSIAGTVSIAKGGILAAGNSPGTLTVGGLNLADGAVLNYELGQANTVGGPLNDLVKVNGDLQLDGTLNVAQSVGGTFGAGLYRLISYTGDLTDNGLDIGIAPVAVGDLQVQTSVAQQVNLVNRAGLSLNFWDGGDSTKYNDGQVAGGSGTWRVGTPGDGWTGTDGKINAAWAQGQFAVFGGTAGTVSVNDDGGTVRITGTQFATDGYRVQGDAIELGNAATTVRVGDGTAAGANMTATVASALTGTGGLVKEDLGTLVLDGINSYSGGTTIKGGILQISSDANLGADTGGLALEGGATLHVTAGVSGTRAVSLGAGVDTFDIDPIEALTLDGTVSGAGRLRKTGAGLLQLGAANDYTGGTEIAAGSLNALVTGALGSGPVSVADNASLVFANTADAGKLAITVAARGGAPTDNGGFVQFRDTSSASSASITANQDAVVEFRDKSTAGNAVIENRGGSTDFRLGASAGKAQITNLAGGGSINLFDDASAGQARLVNESGGLIDFFDRASADQATVVNDAGAQLRLDGLTNAGLSIGSLEGAGNVLLGAKALTTGGLNTSTTVSGAISGAGGSVVKVGSGTLSLSGANTYTGGTTVAAGTLSANNASGSATGTGAVQVQDGATLAGNGSIAGTVNIAKGGVLSAGNGNVGTLTLGGLSLADGAVLNYDLGQAGTAGGALNDLVKVNGNLQLDGTLNVAQSKGGVFGAGIYRLIDYTGDLIDNGLEIGSAPTAAKDLQVQTSVASQVNLVNRAGLALNFWDGGDAGKYNDGKIAGGSGTWRVGVPGDGWTGMDGKINAAWAQDQFAVFAGTGGTVTVDDAGGTVRITGAQFAADGYVVQGDAIELGASGTVVRVGDGSGTDTARSATVNVALTGTGGLVKEDVGRLILGGANSYTGGTTVKAGVLQGSAASLQGDIVNDAEVAFDQDKTAGTYAGAMSGTGKLRKIGTGTLTLAGANSYGGGTFVDAGTLATDVTGALGSGAASVASGATLQFGGGFDAGTTAIGNQGTVRFQDKASAGTSTITNAAGGVLAFADDASADKATVINQAGAQVRIDQATTEVSIGALSGAGETVLGAKALTLGGLGGSATLSGAISGTGGSIVKVGAGTLTLTGASSYTGGTIVDAGMLSVNNKSGSATGSGAVLVQSGATLAGSGTIAGAVTIANGGILAAGNSPGTLTLGALALAGGATLNYELGQAGVPGGALNDLINVGGNLQLDGTLNIAQSAGGSFGPGLYRLVSYGGTLTDNGLDIGTVPVGAKQADLQVQTSVANQVNLVNRAGLSLNFWDGGDSTRYNDNQVAGGSGTWRVGSPHPSLDGWTDMDGKLNANWAQDQFAIFGGKSGTVTVDDTGGAVRISGAQFAVDGYVVQGDGITLNAANTVVRVGDGTAAGADMTATMNVALGGTGGLSKEDAGRLILGGANTYTGGTTVKGGVLQGSATSLQGDIINNAEVSFDQDKTTGTYAGTLSGTGRVRKIGTGTLVLGGANSYAGGTLVDAGTLATSVTGALGSGAVSVAADAALQFGGAASAGKLAYTLAKAGTGSTGGSLQFTGTSSAGSATIDNQGGSVRFQDGASAGTASIANGTGGVVAFADKASAGKASVSSEAGAQVRIDQAATGVTIGSLSGAGDVVLGANALALGGLNGDAVLSGAISGAGGSLVKMGTGTLTLSGTAGYSGETLVAMGSLKAGAANAFSAASSGVVASGATLDLAGFSQKMAGLANAGTVSLLGTTPGTTLTLSGPYVGNNGVLRLAAKLDNPGIADRLVLDGAGATASGHTTVQVTNLGGLGARTSGAGIEVISARNGATTTAQTTKDAFALSGGHVDAGAFEYRLYAGDAGGSGENWYLRTEAEPGAALPTYRAEASLFAALPSQLRQGDLSMLGNLRQRIGDDDVLGSAGASSSAEGGNRRAWGRLISTDMDIRQGGTVSPHGEGRMTGLQAGTDLLATSDWRAGIYVGQLEGNTGVSGFASGLVNTAAGSNDLRSQYLGAYGTYAGEAGFYADAVLQAGRHRYTLQPQFGAGISGKGSSLLASIEVGKAFALGTSGWAIEPQLQLIHQSQRLDDAPIAGAVVQQDADSSWTGRAGVRIKGSIATGIGTGIGTLQPYGRLNVYRSSSGNDVARFVSPAAITPVGAPIGGTSTELAAGFTLAMSDRTSLYGEFGKLWASGGASRVGSSINAGVGVRVKW